MKVLFYNRSNYLENSGDIIQMVKTKEKLEKLGVEVDITSTSKNSMNYDIVHIFNTQFIDDNIIKQIENAKKNKVPIALSTIYWDMKLVKREEKKYSCVDFPIINKLGALSKNLPYLISNIICTIDIIQFLKNKKSNEAIPFLLENADILLPNSYAELEILSMTFNMPEIRGKSIIIPNGISLPDNNSIDKYKDNDLKLPDSYVLQVGHIIFYKNQLNLIKALFNYPEIPLVFVGKKTSPYYYNECLKLGKKRGNTYFIDNVPHEQVYSYYTHAKVHVLPSLRDSPGLTSLEAAFSECNCVVSIHSPVSEYFGFDAFVCDPLKLDSIRDAVLNAWYSPKNDNLKKRIVENFTWDKAASKTLEAYKNVLKLKK